MNDCNPADDYHTFILFDSFVYQNAFVRKSRPLKLSTFQAYLVRCKWNFMKTTKTAKTAPQNCITKPQKPTFQKPHSVFNTSHNVPFHYYFIITNLSKLRQLTLASLRYNSSSCDWIVNSSYMTHSFPVLQEIQRVYLTDGNRKHTFNAFRAIQKYVI